MKALLKGFVVLFGAVCMAIALVHIGYGPASIPGSVPVNATMDSEDRFYATLFLGFGAASIWCAQDLGTRAAMFRALMLVFFIGGIARLISAVQVGLPSPLFVFLGGLELAIPPILLWARAKAFPG
ncbi:MAG: DUF4345 domain-containing protein [Novosphingobium sp.]|uniref:DUF4345 domain-containing protein n=1 Tax=Novosphingobium sp. TaxID=1874826 RepID=UPI00301B52F6